MRGDSRPVSEFKVGDRISLYGWLGTVKEVKHEVRDKLNYKNEVIGEMPCTYVRVGFDEPEKIGYQYEDGWYGGSDELVSYGYIGE